MKKNLFVVAAVALMAMVSCNKEEANNGVVTPEGTMEFTAYVDGAMTKATFETDDVTKGAETHWEIDDEIYVNGEKFTVKDGEEAGLSVTFVGNKVEAPFKAVFAPAEGSFSAVEIHAAQSAVTGKEAVKNIVSVAYAEAGETALEFKNVTSLLMFEVPVACSTVTISSDDALAGTVSVTDELSVSEGTETTVTLEGSFATGTKYYAAVLPGTKANLTFVIDGTVVGTIASFTINSSSVVNFGTLPEPTVKVYMKPSSGWASNATSFAAYVWNDSGDNWYEMTDTNNDGVYEAAISVEYNNIIFVSKTAAFAADWNNKYAQTADLLIPADDNNAYVIYSSEWTTLAEAQAFEEPAKVCKLIVKVSTQIDWYDKYIYCWTSGSNTAGWPGTKLNWDKEDGNYYVYYHDFPYSLNGKTIDFCISKGEGGAGNQTNDLSVALNGEETTFIVESSHVKQ